MWMEEKDGQNQVFQYEPCKDGIRMIRCFALYETERFVIPEKIAEMPVREIGPYAFSHAEGEKERRDGSSCLRAVGGNTLREVICPDTLVRIGRLAWYNCENLQKVAFYDTIDEIEDGAFKNCDGLCEITVYAVREKLNCMKQVLIDVEQKVSASVEYKKGRKKAKLVFPEFGYGFEENCPGRIFHEYTYGSGNSYRQCFYDGMIRYQRYDELFSMATREDPKETVFEIAFNRLEYPYQLLERDKKKYELYLREHKKEAGTIVVKNDDLHRLQMLFDWKIFKREDFEWLIDLAGREHMISCLAWLMDQKLSIGMTKKKTFQF